MDFEDSWIPTHRMQGLPSLILSLVEAVIKTRFFHNLSGWPYDQGCNTHLECNGYLSRL